MYLLSSVKETCPLDELLNVLMSVIETKDSYTKGHSDRVVEVAHWICKALKLTENEAKSILLASHLHDIGKIYLPDAILNKPSMLTQEEWLIMKQHPQYGFNILKKVSHFAPILDMVLYHHERWDGKGYPFGISNTDIPLGARILSLADAIDAMLSNRVYRKALSVDRCVSELKNNSERQFDPHLVHIAVDFVLKNAAQTA